ncbi:MAG: hypothetical protein Kow0098_09780 [Ignavibacteriaceae bacterium]
MLTVINLNLFAQKFWNQTGNELNVQINDFTISSGNNWFLAAGLFDETEAGIYKSTDNGQTWQLKTAAGSAAFFITEYADKLWAGSFQGLHYSTDNGESWITDSIQGTRFGYFNSFTFNSQGNLFAGFSAGLVFSSTDGGFNWSIIFENIDNTTRIYSLKINSDNQLFVAANEKIFRSDDLGNSWVNLTSNIPSDQINSIRAIQTINRNTVLIATYGQGVFRSEDDGQSWVKINSGLIGLDYNEILSKDGNLIFIGGNSLTGSSSGVYYSVNGGNFWKSLNEGFDYQNITGFFFDDSDWIFCTSVAQTGFYSALYKSIFPLDYWQPQYQSGTGKLNDIFFADPFNGFACSDDGKILKTNNSGQGWSEKIISDEVLNSVYFINSTDWVVGNNGVILTSSDGGENWITLPNVISSDFSDVKFSSEFSGIVTGDSGTIIRSTDGGLNWSVIATGENRNINSVFYKDETNLWAAGDDGLVLQSVDGGLTWTERFEGIFNQDNFHKIWFDENNNSGWLFAEESMYKTTDGGMSWQQVIPAENSLITASELSSFNNITNLVRFDISSETINQVYTSDDAGETWSVQLIPSDIQFTSIFLLNDSTLWLSGDKGTIFTTIKNYPDPTFVNEISQVSENQIVLEQNYPNPFNPTTEISWYSLLPEKQKLVIYNILGEQVRVLFDQLSAAGYHKIKFDASGLPGGIYFYSLSAGNHTITRKMILLR